MDARQRVIYALIDPRSLLIRYVGQTVLSAGDRLKQHVQAAKRGNVSYRSNWIRQLLDNGLTPDVEVLESGFWTLVDVDSREMYWVDCLKNSPIARLTNMNDGGGGVNRVVTPEALERQVAGIRTWWAKPESRIQQSLAIKKRYEDPEERARTSETAKVRAARMAKRRIRCTDCGVVGNPMSLVQHGRWHKHYGREELTLEDGD